MGSLTAAGKSLVAAGQLDQRVILLSPTVAEDELGQRVETMAPVVTVWAQAQPLRGREYIAAQAGQNEASVRFRIRWRWGIDTTWRVRWRGVDYRIISDPIDVNGARIVLELMCATAEAGS